MPALANFFSASASATKALVSGSNRVAAGNAAGPAVAARLQTPVELRSQRVDDDGVAVGAGLQRFPAVDEIARLRFRGERRRRIALGGPGLDGAALCLPLVEPAIEHGGAFEADR